MKLKPIPIGYSSWVRADAEEPPIAVENRYFEKNPTSEGQSALIARPGFKYWYKLTNSPIDNLYTQPGSFQDSLFAATESKLYRVTKAESISSVSGTIFNSLFGGTSGAVTIRMAATARIGGTPEYLWAADGASLWLYADSTAASGKLTVSNINNGDTVVIGGTYYQFVTSGVDTGSPAGTSGNPWKVLIDGFSVANSVRNLRGAINDDGSSGVAYSTATTAHPNAYAYNNGLVLEAYSRAMSAVGNTIATTETGASMSWGASTLTGGGSPGTVRVLMPDDIPPIDLFFIAGYIVVVCTSGFGVNGRFYWINPGETVIDPLNFATAERSPDGLYGGTVLDDQFMLFGATTTEIWYPSGDFGTPFQRLEGKLFNRGIWPGTNLKVGDSVMIVDNNGVVQQITGSPQRVSDNSIEERIRKSMAAQRIANTVMRTWTMSVDGHDFYIIYLPLQGTLVYDLTTQSWTSWSSGALTYLNQHVGINWQAAGDVVYGHGQKSNIVAGDLTSGVLYLGNPSLGADDNTSGGGFPFSCRVVGGIEVLGRDIVPCFGVYLEGSMGVPKTGTLTVKLETSDDVGNTWVDRGDLTVTAADYGQELAWRNLGRINKPGRLFRVTDRCALTRIDSLEINSG